MSIVPFICAITNQYNPILADHIYPMVNHFYLDVSGLLQHEGSLNGLSMKMI